jgi:short-subunit dehydrogenase
MQTVLISGGSDGLGKVIAKQLVPDYRVIILSPSEEKLKQTAQEIGCEFRLCDVRDYDQVEGLIRDIGVVDCLINNAGLWIQGPLDENDQEHIRNVIDVNTLGTLYLTKAVIPVMKQRMSGRIVNVISQAGLNAKAERAIYNASKWALTGFTKSIQEELAPFGIGVTGLYPGKLKTDMFKKMGIDKSMDDALDPKEVAKTVEFILSLKSTTLFPEVGIKHLEN